MRLSDDALWLWRDLWEDGAEILDGDRDELLGRFGDEDGEPWSLERLEAAIAELRARSILKPGGEVESPVVEMSSSRITDDGLLVQIALVVIATEEVVERKAWRAISDVVDDIEPMLHRTGRPSPRRTTFALYWCETRDHDEDWFVIASSGLLAEHFFERYEGYDPGDCTASWVADVPDGLRSDQEEGWPSDDEIRACGGEFLPMVPGGTKEDAAAREVMGVVSKAVRFGSRTYAAGDIVANQVARQRRGPRN
ncbi:hypothetical protein [Sandaracinus amylolyticus]|uniref:hypothetical protein n=1 Tax=Sandaracinus amylolyticus TaxID=927083 RepID=UPI001F1E3B74|nr:hypothetical protein [Sandaracinus amylolyticus]UJR84281.1 Hypothetical protein I5071_63590 [Sandaracinus amylolyticus]